MQNKIFNITIIPDNPNDNFSSMISLIDSIDIQIDFFHSLNAWLASENIRTTGLVIISTTNMDVDEITNFSNNKSRIKCPVVVAGNYSKIETEYKLRAAGVSCYLLLPEESKLIIDYIAVARRSQNRQPDSS